MSSGDFFSAKYEDDKGTVRNIRVQPETLAATFGTAANAQPAGAVAAGYVSATIQAGRRERGICRARRVYIRWETKPTDYTGDFATIAVMQKSVFDAIAIGSDVAYLGGAAKVTSKDAERIS